MGDAWCNMFYYLQQENAVLKEKYNELSRLVGEIIEAVKSDAKQRIEKKRDNSKIRCKFQNRCYCKEGSQCDYFHPEGICQEHSHSERCSQEKTCPSRHPNKCKFWIRGHCWRESTCVYLHRPEDVESELDDKNEPDDKHEPDNKNEPDDKNELDEEVIHVYEDNHDDKEYQNGEENHDENFKRSITTDEILAMYASESESEKIQPVKKSTKKKRK